MDDLVTTVIEAHGGLDRYNRFSSATVHFRLGGSLWRLKGQEGTLSQGAVRLSLHRQYASHHPFTAAGLWTSVTARRVAVETVGCEVKAERFDPRASFPSDAHAAWDELQVAYFAGYAMWTYLTSPFTFGSPGFRSVELPPVVEEGEIWRRLEVTFPDHIATHCRRQVFFFDSDGLLRRHDYTPEVVNAGPAAHYPSAYEEFDGIMVPTRRRVYRLGEDGTVSREQELVTIDIDDVVFT
ncbi:hypothetical protein [Streptomyces sp. 142MFCol3.1]|uniref:hypothetical protein n=1 Tax=Streptomyces sp. 142MFCol3.1 TaxID=1172179 RepID=UPI0003FCF3D9|nr:hypothetical protein [Streptomyces sp. 142MFCol3.1]